MALPQRRDPYERERDFGDIDNRPVQRGPANWWLAWWWIWLLIIIAAIWFAGWGWGGYGGWWWGPGTVGITNVQPSGEGVAVLNAANKQPFVGQAFSIGNVRVEEKVNGNAFWIPGNQNAGAPMLVVVRAGGAGNTGNLGANPAGTPNQTANGNRSNAPGNSAATGRPEANGNMENIGEGDIVNVTGTVEKAPPQAQAKQQWSLSDDEAERLQQQGAYIRANQVEEVRR